MPHFYLTNTHLSLSKCQALSKCFTKCNLFNPNRNTLKCVVILISILKMRTLRHREVGNLLEGTQLLNGPGRRPLPASTASVFRLCLFRRPILPSPLLDTTQQTLPTSRKPPLMSSCLWVPMTPCTSPHSSPAHGILLFWFVCCLLYWMLSISTGEAVFHPLCSLLPSPAFPEHPLSMLQPEAAFKNKTSFYHSTV